MFKNRKGFVKVLLTLVLAVVGISIMWSLQSSATASLVTTNQTLNYTTAPTAAEFTLTPTGQELLVSTFTLENSSGSAFDSSNYTVTEAGVLTFTNAANQTNMVAEWTYEPTGYVSGGTTRTVIGFVTVFFAVLVIAFLARNMA